MAVAVAAAMCFIASNVWSAGTPSHDSSNGGMESASAHISGSGSPASPTSAPAAPVMAVIASGLRVTPYWNSVSGADGYTLFYAPYPSASPIRSMDMSSRTRLSVTLNLGAAYYVAVKAYNAAGSSSYSNIKHFTLTTPAAAGPTVTDVEGNVYNSVIIGAQTWMRENLKVTKYRDGTAIPTTTATISSEASPKYQWAYAGLEGNVSTYGRLYTWYAATDSRGLCPSGWHLPTDAEWDAAHLGGLSVAGGHLKEVGTTHWSSPNTGADNSSGFTALPGGCRGGDGIFYFIGNGGFWWSATESESTYAFYRNLGYGDGSVRWGSIIKGSGLSVRCVED